MPSLKPYRSLLLSLLTLFIIITVQGQGNSPQLDAPLRDSLLVDKDGDGRLDAGDTLRYTLEITNCGNVPAENVQLTGQVDPNTQFLANSVQVGAPGAATNCPTFPSEPPPADVPESTETPTLPPVTDAPSVVNTDPADNASEVPLNTNISIEFSKPVDLAGDWFQVVCNNSGTFNVTSANITVTGGPLIFTLDPNIDLQVGETCEVTVFAAQVTDTDAPPDNMAADYIFSFTTDTPPTVVSTDPTNGATAVLNSSDIVVTFDEPVNVTAASFTLECPATVVFAGGFSVSGTGTTIVTINPTGNLPSGTSCQIVIVAPNVTDNAGNTLDGGNYTFSFTTDLDAAPSVQSITPANGAVSVPTNTIIEITFSEWVDIASETAFSLQCPPGTSRGFTVTTPGALPASATNFVLTPSDPLPDATTCTVIVSAAGVSDSDSDDPPNNMAADFVSTFTTEAPPNVTATNPDNLATGIGTGSNIVIDFNEPVDVTTNSFTIECSAETSYAVAGSGTNSITLDPDTNLPANQACSVTVIGDRVFDTDLIDPPDNMLADYSFTFETILDLAPSVNQPNIVPASTSTGANSASLNNPVSTTPTITIPFTEAVDAATGAFTLTCNAASVTISTSPALPALGQTSIDVSPVSPIATGANCVLTVVAANVTDADSDDPPNVMVTDFTLSFSVDTAPVETLTETEVGGVFQDVRNAGAINVDLDSAIQITFNESVSVTFPSNGLQCPAGNNIPVTVTTNNAATIVLNPNTNLPPNTLCVLNIPAANISDVDIADAPDNPAAGVSHSFQTVDDDAPTVTTNPAAGGSNVATNSNITVTFNEAVTRTGNWFALSCSLSGLQDIVSGITVVENTPDLVYTMDPATDLMKGEICTITIDSANVADNDVIDPPNQLDGDASGDVTDGDDDDYVATFSTADMPPQVDRVTSTPASNETVGAAQVVTLNFTEAVDVADGAFTFECPPGTPLGFNTSVALPATVVTTIVLTPIDPLPFGAACTVTIDSSLVVDNDPLDPPNFLDGDANGDVIDDADDFSLSFQVDQEPRLLSSQVEIAGGLSPAADATNVDLDSDIVLTFSEAIDLTADGATLECPAGNPITFTGLPATNNAVITMNPTADLPGATLCALNIPAANISDTDTADAPDNPADGVSLSFTTQAAAADDTYTVTPHLTYESNVAGLSVRDNDQPATVSITGFGTDLASADGTEPNGTNSITAGGAGGRVVLNANGTFIFYPDSVATGSATFFYTITGGDTAQVTLTFDTQEFVWFVDNSASGANCTGTNVGTQACPAATLAAVVALDTPNDTIFVASGNYTCGITLEMNERLIGDGSSSTLQALSGVTPVVGSNFDPYSTFSGTDPVLTSSAADCITLATGNTINGVTIGDTGNFAGIVGTSYGTATILETTVNGTGRILNLDTGTINATFDSLSSSSSDSSFAGLRVANSTINNFTSLGGTTVNGSAAGVEAILLISNTGTGFNLGTTSVTKTTAGRGVVLGNGTVQSAPVTFASLAITTSTGTALETNRQTGTVTVSTNTGSISATSGAAVNIINAVGNTTPLAMNLGALTANNSSLAATCLAGTQAAGFCATGATGTMTASSMTVTTGTNRYGIRINSSGAAFTFTTVSISGMTSTTPEVDSQLDGYPDNFGDGDGVFLDSNSGSFTINGGTIQNTTSTGADNVDIRFSRNIVINNTSLSGAGKSNFQAINMTGTGSFNNGLVTGAANSSVADAFYFRASTGTLTRFDIDNTNCDMTTNTNADDCFEYTSSGDHTGFVDIGGVGDTGVWRSNTNVVEAIALGTSNLRLNMESIDVTPVSTGLAGMILAPTNNATLIFRVLNNNFTNIGNGLSPSVDGVIRIIPQDAASSLRGRFEGNLVDLAGGASRQAIRVVPLNTMNNFELYINNNTLEASGFEPAIFFRTDGIAEDAPALSNAHVFIQNNTITSQGTTPTARGIEIQIHDLAGSNNIRMDIRNNNINTTGGSSANAIRVRMQQNAINAHVTVVNNTLNSGANPEFIAEISHAANNFCLTLTGHTSGEYNLSRSAGTFNFFNGGNAGATISQTGTITPSGACILPTASGLVQENGLGELYASLPVTPDDDHLLVSVLGEAFGFDAQPAYAQSNNFNIPLGPINIGTIPANSTVTVTFDVLVSPAIPAGTSHISLQGTISGSNFASILTDDPETPLDMDATLTALDSLQAVSTLPQTGETIWWQSFISWGLRLGLFAIVVLGLIAIRRRFFRSV